MKISAASNRHGFTLIETIVALGVLSVVGVIASQLMSNNMLANRSVEVSNRFTSLVASIGLVLNNPVACAQALGGKAFDAAQIPLGPTPGHSPISVSPLALAGGPIAVVGQAVDGLKLNRIEFNRILQDLGVQPSGRQGYLVNLHVEANKVGLQSATPLPGRRARRGLRRGDLRRPGVGDAAPHSEVRRTVIARSPSSFFF